MAKYSTPLWQDGASPAIDAASLLAIGQAIEETQCPYAVCSTAAGTAAKTATISLSGTLSLFNGLTVRIKFTYSNTAGNPTLNVNGTGAKPIRNYGTTPTVTWKAGQILTFTYDGSGWLISGAVSDTKIATGSYSGTGVFGSSNMNTLTFPFAPSMVIIHEEGSGTTTNGYARGDFAIFTQTASSASTLDGFSGTSFRASGGNSVAGFRERGQLASNVLSWYNTEAAVYQLNASGTTYYWVAIG